ncbi:hypothetical protein E2P84_29645 [Burkholderia cepacia]|uniref:Uncharacterized protein n=1 Tax=Burkholderia cepacia TaxID=292 RepID=A0AAX2RG88_BURCE|nr:hypothetical protein E2P84_29645 [Burkholderia cepacia]TET05424.1 hypothetical protein E3D36_00525 [Burkholderia cepacia]TEU36586.1 hypothetical protein E3D37_35230 [Burkholderia cepacia]TEU42343.1 hypothetical protein E3D39_15365 [Burkholderia cepacia]TEU57533.1 hypothetical protein E3D38_03670 [Burkholderia cepacia]
MQAVPGGPVFSACRRRDAVRFCGGGGHLHGAAAIPARRPDLALHRIALRQCPVDIGRIALDPEKP